MIDNEQEAIDHSALLHLYRLMGELKRCGRKADVAAMGEDGFQWIDYRDLRLTTLLIHADGSIDLVSDDPDQSLDYHWEPLDFSAKDIVARWLEATGKLTLN